MYNRIIYRSAHTWWKLQTTFVYRMYYMKCALLVLIDIILFYMYIRIVYFSCSFRSTYKFFHKKICLVASHLAQCPCKRLWVWISKEGLIILPLFLSICLSSFWLKHLLWEWYALILSLCMSACTVNTSTAYTRKLELLCEY